jgi:hypothetical protein
MENVEREHPIAAGIAVQVLVVYSGGRFMRHAAGENQWQQGIGRIFRADLDHKGQVRQQGRKV